MGARVKGRGGVLMLSKSKEREGFKGMTEGRKNIKGILEGFKTLL